LHYVSLLIIKVVPLAPTVFQVDLHDSAGHALDYRAGQYLELIIDGRIYPFTIANAPGQKLVQLHIGVDYEKNSNVQIVAYLHNNLTVQACLPKGNVWLPPPRQLDQDPLAFVVAGTGFAQAKAMIEDQLKYNHSALSLYWVNRDPLSQYSDWPKTWSKFGLIDYHAISDNQHVSEKLVAAHGHNIGRLMVIVCGGPKFVYAILNGLESVGVKKNRILSDVFSYSTDKGLMSNDI